MVLASESQSKGGNTSLVRSRGKTEKRWV